MKRVEPVAPPPPALKSSIKFTAPVIKKDEEVHEDNAVSYTHLDVYKRQTDKMRGLHRLSSLDKLRMRISSITGVRAWVLRSMS